MLILAFAMCADLNEIARRIRKEMFKFRIGWLLDSDRIRTRFRAKVEQRDFDEIAYLHFLSSML